MSFRGASRLTIHTLSWDLKLYDYCSISDNKIKIIKQAEKRMLYHNGCLWIKRSNTEFNIAMDAFDFSEACELVRMLLLWRLSFLFDIKHIGFYRDDGVILVCET